MLFLLKLIPKALLAGKLLLAGITLRLRLHKLKKMLDRIIHPAKQKEDFIMMKKTTFGAILALLACAVGALTAAALYLRRREKELDEYEELLFSTDFNEEVPSDEPAEEDAEEAVEEAAEEE